MLPLDLASVNLHLTDQGDTVDDGTPDYLNISENELSRIDTHGDQGTVIGTPDATAAAADTMDGRILVDNDVAPNADSQNLALVTDNTGTGDSAAIYDGVADLGENGTLTVSELSLFAEGAINLSIAGAGGTITTRATADTQGDIVLDNESAATMVVGDVFWEHPDAHTGIETTASSVLIQSSGNLTVDATDSINVGADGFLVAELLNAEDMITLNGPVATNNGEIHLTADGMNLNNTITAGDGGAGTGHNVYLNSESSFDGDDTIRFGAADAAGAVDVLGLSQAELLQVTIASPADHALVVGEAARATQIDRDGSGNITAVNGLTRNDGSVRLDTDVDLTTANFDNLALAAGTGGTDHITDNAGAETLTVPGNVALRAGGNVTGTNAATGGDNNIWDPLRVNAGTLTADVEGYLLVQDAGGLDLADAVPGIDSTTLVNMPDEVSSGGGDISGASAMDWGLIVRTTGDLGVNTRVSADGGADDAALWADGAMTTTGIIDGATGDVVAGGAGVEADHLALFGQTGIGSAANPVITQAATLTASSPDGGIYVTEQDTGGDLTLDVLGDNPFTFTDTLPVVPGPDGVDDANDPWPAVGDAVDAGGDVVVMTQDGNLTAAADVSSDDSILLQAGELGQLPTDGADSILELMAAADVDSDSDAGGETTDIITFIADQMEINGAATVNSRSALTYVRPLELTGANATDIEIGGAGLITDDTPAVLDLTQGELNTISGAGVIVGRDATGAAVAEGSILVQGGLDMTVGGTANLGLYTQSNDLHAIYDGTVGDGGNVITAEALSMYSMGAGDVAEPGSAKVDVSVALGANDLELRAGTVGNNSDIFVQSTTSAGGDIVFPTDATAFDGSVTADTSALTGQVNGDALDGVESEDGNVVLLLQHGNVTLDSDSLV